MRKNKKVSKGAYERGYLKAVKDCAILARRWAKNYPIDVFPPPKAGDESSSVRAAAQMARHTCETLAMKMWEELKP